MSELQAILSSNAIPVTVDSRLVFTVWAPTADPIDLTARITQLTDTGQIVESVEQFTASQSAFPRIKNIQLTNNRLVAASISTSTQGLADANIYVAMALQANAIATPENTLALTSGYITYGSGLSYPLSPPRNPGDTFAGIYQKTATQPAAGVELNLQFNGAQLTQIIGGITRLNTSAVVASRTVNLQVFSDAFLIANIPARTAQLAGTDRQYILWKGPGIPADVAPYIYMQLPDDLIATNYSLSTATTNIDAGDQFQESQFLISTRLTI